MFSVAFTIIQLHLSARTIFRIELETSFTSLLLRIVQVGQVWVQGQGRRSSAVENHREATIGKSIKANWTWENDAQLSIHVHGWTGDWSAFHGQLKGEYCFVSAEINLGPYSVLLR